MYNNIIKLIILTVLILPFQNYNSQMIKSELNPDGNNFNQVRIENIDKVFLLKGNENSIIIETNSDKYKLIDFKIVDGIAFIKAEHKNEDEVNYNIYITSKSDEIFINGFNIGAFRTKDKVYFKTIKLKIFNCAKIDLLVATQSLFCDIQNVFSFKIAGHTDKITLQKKNVMLSSLRKLNISTN